MWRLKNGFHYMRPTVLQLLDARKEHTMYFTQLYRTVNSTFV